MEILGVLEAADGWLSRRDVADLLEVSWRSARHDLEFLVDKGYAVSTVLEHGVVGYRRA